MTTSVAPGPWLRPLGRALTTPKDPKKRIFEERSEVVRTRCIAVLPGGARAVSGGVGGVRIWNLKTGGTLHLLPKPDYISRSRYYEVKALAVTPDGKTIIAASGDGAESLLQVIDAEAGEERKAIHEAPNVNAICTTPDGRYVITGCLQRLRVWNLSTGTIEHDIERMATAVAATADGRYFVACGRDLVTVWNLRSGTVLREFAAEEASNTLVITPDGRLAIVGDKPAKLSGYDLETGRKVVNFEGHQRGLYALALTPDGFRLVSGSHDGTVRVWRVATGELEATFEHLGGAVAVAVTPDGTQCLSAGYDDAVRLWDLSFRGHHATPAKHKGRVRAITFTPDGKYFLSAGEDSAVRVFDVSTLQEVRTLEGHRRDVFAIAVTPDSRYAITGGLDHDVRVWELATGEPVWVMPGHHYCVRGLAVLSDRKRVVSGAEDSTLAVWDLESGMRLSIINNDAGEVQCVGLTSDGTKVIFADQGWSIHVKDIASGELLQTFRGHDERASALTLTPDGRKLISGWLDQKIRIWEFNTGNQLAVFQTKDQVLSVSVIGDKYVVSGEGDGAMRVRDLRTGQVIASLTSDSRSMVAAVAPDGPTLVAGDYGGCVHVVRLEGTEIS